jgi:adenylate cyclase
LCICIVYYFCITNLRYNEVWQEEKQKSKRKKPFLLKYISELLKQVKSLKEENEKLAMNNELLFRDYDNARKALARSRIEEKQPENGEVKKTKRYRGATILFIDVYGTMKAEKSARNSDLADSLDEIIRKVKEILLKYNINQIKVKEGSIICTGGIPKEDVVNQVNALTAAIELQFYIKYLVPANRNKGIWKLRIGIHTGSVSATLVNKKKQVYEAKGSALDIASRIRQVCSEGQILVSANTYELSKDFFVCEYFGSIPAKYHGDMPLYMVKGMKPEFSMRGRGIIPNKRMNIRIGLARFVYLQEKMLDKMESELPPGLYYHNIKHTVDVVTQAEIIGLGECVSDEELLLLKTAALFHDTGHIHAYNQHEYYSTVIARTVLPEYGYTETQIEKVCELIMATKLPPKPLNILEKIICDADLDYLGRSDMVPVSNTLYMEMKERRMIDCLNDWNNIQIKFISGHQYFTETAKNLREVNKQMQIERIKKKK